MDDLIGDNFSEQAMQAIHDAEIRRKYAEAILRIRAVEDKAIRYIEELLKKI
jgi:hypothetical protein